MPFTLIHSSPANLSFMRFALFFIAIVALPNALAEELPGMLETRITQMNWLQRGDAKLTSKWPDGNTGLFQGIRKNVKAEIVTKKDHLDAIATIPKHLLKDRIIGETLELDGWFYTSVEHKGWDNKKPSWFNVIASAKNTKVLCFSYTW